MTTSETYKEQIPEINHELFEYMSGVYGPTNIRYRRPRPFGERIKVDDRGNGEAFDVLYGISMEISPTREKRFELTFMRVPAVEEFAELIEYYGGEVEYQKEKSTLDAHLEVAITNVMILRDLANAFHRRVKRGAPRYHISNWKWICPRTGESIDRLANHIMDFRRERR